MKKLQGGGGGGAAEESLEDNLAEECDLEMGKLKSDDETSLHEEEESLLMEDEKRVARGQAEYLGQNRMMELPKVIVTSSRSINRASSDRATPARLATPDPDIQLAEPKLQNSMRSLGGGSGGEQQGLRCVCGPHPAKITKICIVVLSIWASWIFLIHLSRRVGDLSERLDVSEQALRSLEKDSQAYRSQSQHRLAQLQEQLQQIKHSHSQGATKRVLKKFSNSGGNKGVKPQASQPVVPVTAVPAVVPTTQPDLQFEDGTPNKQEPSMCTSKGEPCILPFSYKGQTYSGCHQSWTDLRPWCPIRVDADGVYVVEQTTWGYCQPCT